MPTYGFRNGYNPYGGSYEEEKQNDYYNDDYNEYKEYSNHSDFLDKLDDMAYKSKANRNRKNRDNFFDYTPEKDYSNETKQDKEVNLDEYYTALFYKNLEKDEQQPVQSELVEEEEKQPPKTKEKEETPPERHFEINLKKGYVMVPREIIESPLWTQKPAWYFKVYFYLLTRVNHTASESFERGEGFFNFQLERFMDISPTNIYDFLRWAKSKKANLLTSRKTTRGVIIKIKDYDFYHNPQNYIMHNKKKSA